MEGCGSDSLQGDVRFAEVMGLMGATVQWAPYSITITGGGGGAGGGAGGGGANQGEGLRAAAARWG